MGRPEGVRRDLCLLHGMHVPCTPQNHLGKVEPKILALRAAEAELAGAVKEQAAAQASLDEVAAKLERMRTDLDAAVAEKARLEADTAATASRADTAGALLGALAGEEARWTAQAAEFNLQIQQLTGGLAGLFARVEGRLGEVRQAHVCLCPPTHFLLTHPTSPPGDCIIASGFLSYGGPFSRDFRDALAAQHLEAGCDAAGVPRTRGLKPAAFLVEEAEVGEWNLEVRG